MWIAIRRHQALHIDVVATDLLHDIRENAEAGGNLKRFGRCSRRCKIQNDGSEEPEN
jgi:hypothetical protein